MFPTRALALSAAAVLALSVGHGLAQPKPEPEPKRLPTEKDAMAEKRERAHAVLDALTAGDADALLREATGLAKLAERPIFLTGVSRADEQRYKTEEYQFQVEKFKRAVGDLLTASKAKNLDGAALAYSDLTRTCVKCHAHFRGTAPKKE
jgi:cytochrome c556